MMEKKKTVLLQDNYSLLIYQKYINTENKI